MAEPGGSDAKGFDWQNRRLGTQRENRRELAIPEPRVGGLCEPGGLLAGSAGKRQADRQQNMAGSTYRRREAVVAVAVGELLQGRAKTVAALADERLGSTTRRLAQVGGNGFVGLGEEEIKGDDLRSGLVEHCERTGEEGARERPPAEAFKAAVVDEDHHHFRPWWADPAQPEPQIERCRLEPADEWIIGQDSEHQHHEGGADQRHTRRAHAPRQSHGVLSY